MRARAQPNDLPPTSGRTSTRCTERMGTAALREIRNATEKSGITRLAGDRPFTGPFTRGPVGALAALAAVLAHNGVATLQYAASAGFAPQRERGRHRWHCRHCTHQYQYRFPHERC